MKMNVGALRGKLRKSRLRWKGHVARKEESYVGKMVQQLHEGKRKRARLKRR